MKEIRYFARHTQRKRENFPYKTAFGFFLLLSLLPGQAWAETYPLESIDFVAAGSQTNIILHTGSIVPVQKVLISDNKLMLDIDQIDATETIRTNFADAANISHVILQPLNEHKVRLIIRGSRLGTPSLAFYNASNGAYSATGNDSSALAEPEPAPFKMSGNETESDPIKAAAIPEESKTVSVIEENTPTPASRSAEASVLPATSREPEALPPEKETPALKMMPQVTAKTEPLSSPLPLSKTSARKPTDLQSEPIAQLMASASPWLTYLPYGLIGLVLLALGLFIRRRLTQISQSDPQTEEWLTTKGKRSSFREMADEYRSRQEGRSFSDNPRQSHVTPRKSETKDVIGLRSLAQNPFPDEQTELRIDRADPPPGRPSIPPAPSQDITPPATTPSGNPGLSLETLLAAMQKAQAAQQKTPVRPNINPYIPPSVNASKNTGKPGTTKPRSGNPGGLSEQPSSTPAVPVNQALAARKNTTSSKNASKNAQKALLDDSRQGPLPGNPEVLNFLRNVAELMEKDGKTEIAQNIQKNLNRQNIGLRR